MNEPHEYCPVKSFVCKALRHPFTWILGGVAFGTLSMYAVGKVNDLEKVVWFTAGTAITSTATVIQSYLSNKRAAQEREFQELQAEAQRKYDTTKQWTEHIASLRISAYQDFLKAATSTVSSTYSTDALAMFVAAFSRVKLVTDGLIVSKCQEIHDYLFKQEEAMRDKTKSKVENSKTLGSYLAELTELMKEELRRSPICVTDTSNEEHA